MLLHAHHKVKTHLKTSSTLLRYCFSFSHHVPSDTTNLTCIIGSTARLRRVSRTCRYLALTNGAVRLKAFHGTKYADCCREPELRVDSMLDLPGVIRTSSLLRPIIRFYCWLTSNDSGNYGRREKLVVCCSTSCNKDNFKRRMGSTEPVSKCAFSVTRTTKVLHTQEQTTICAAVQFSSLGPRRSTSPQTSLMRSHLISIDELLWFQSAAGKNSTQLWRSNPPTTLSSNRPSW